MKKILIIVLAAVILLGGGAAAYFFIIAPNMSGGGGAEGVTTEATVTQTPEKVDANAEQFSYSPGDPFIGNIRDSNHHLKASIVLKYTGNEEEGAEKLESKKFDIRDKIVEVLGSISEEDLNSDRGKQIVKHDVLAKMRNDLGLDFVQAVLVTDFVIQ